MKKLTGLLLFCAMLSACGGSDNKGVTPKQKAVEENTVPVPPGPVVSSDCGTAPSINCELFGLTTTEVNKLRIAVPIEMSFAVKAEGADSEQTVAIKRSLYLGQYVRARYKNADMEMTGKNSNDYIEFYSSINWK